MKCALIQLSSSDDPEANLAATVALIREAAGQGAGFVLTPEVTNCVSTSRARQMDVLRSQDVDPTLAALRAEAHGLGVWLSIGSLALKTDDADGRFANRSFMIGPDGRIAAWYDKIHMFDVDVSETERYRESDGYRPGNRAVLADLPFARVGMTICYDLRFPHLYRSLAQAGAEVLLVPSAFSPVTGAAHWEALLRSRAIETGCYVMAAAQCGRHAAVTGKPRETYGHSMVVDPWGQVLVEMGNEVGIAYVDFDADQVSKARRRVPSLRHDKPFESPDERSNS